MRITTLPLLLLILLTIGQDSIATKVDLGNEFKIKNGEEVVVRGEKLRITFSSVVNESRCPDGVACVWAGNASIAIEVSKKNRKKVLAALNTLSEPKEIPYKGFKIRLVALDPYPSIKTPIDPKDYEATLIITKDE